MLTNRHDLPTFVGGDDFDSAVFQHQPIGHLTGFEMLRKIEVSANILVGRKSSHLAEPEDPSSGQLYSFLQLFPTSLEHLHVTECGHHMLKYISTLTLNGILPNLAEVKLELDEKWDSHLLQPNPDETMALIFRERGIVYSASQAINRQCSTCHTNSH